MPHPQTDTERLAVLEQAAAAAAGRSAKAAAKLSDRPGQGTRYRQDKTAPVKRITTSRAPQRQQGDRNKGEQSRHIQSYDVQHDGDYSLSGFASKGAPCIAGTLGKNAPSA